MKPLALLILSCSTAILWGGDISIGVRTPNTKPEEVSQNELQECLKKLGEKMPKALPPDPKTQTPVNADAGWEKSPEAAKLAGEVRNRPEPYMRMIIPPGAPNSVPRATDELRTRAAWILGLSTDRRALPYLVNAAVYDSCEFTRYAAAKALVMLEEPVAMRKLVDIAVSHDFQHCPWLIRKTACLALKRYGDKEAIDRLISEVSFELAGGNALDVHNRLRGVPKGIGTDNPLGVPDAPPITNLSEQDLYPALSAVKEVTGQTFSKGEKDVKTWLSWWNDSKDKFALKE